MDCMRKHFLDRPLDRLLAEAPEIGEQMLRRTHLPEQGETEQVRMAGDCAAAASSEITLTIAATT